MLTKCIAYQAPKGSVSDFIHCYITANPKTLGICLKITFWLDSQKSRIANMHLLFWAKLNRNQVKQCRCMPKCYLHWFCRTRGLDAVESQIIGFFVDGLYHDFLKLKVMHDNPNTFQGVVTVAMNEQNLLRKFNLHSTSSPTVHKEEPVEIGHVRSKKCYKVIN